MALTDIQKISGKESLSEEVQVVEFIIGDDKFAVNLFDVREIVEASKITPLPHAPSHIRGIIDLRGEITTVIDLRKLLHIERTGDSSTTDLRFIVLDDTISSQKTGIVVDEVTSVLTIPIKEIDQTSHSGSDDNGHILGIIKKEVGDRGVSRKELVIWIDVRSLVSSVSS